MITRSQARKQLSSLHSSSPSPSPSPTRRRTKKEEIHTDCRRISVRRHTRVHVLENGVPILETHYNTVYHKLFGHPSGSELFAFLHQTPGTGPNGFY